MTASFHPWLSLYKLSVADLPQRGAFPAVYAFRDSTTQEILKYGHAGCLCQRIFGNFIGAVGGRGPSSTTQFVHAELWREGVIERVEVSWIETEDKAHAELMEKEFRQEYKRTHNGHRPVWDRQD